MVAVLPALATGALTSAGGFAASKLLGGLFGGGGGGSSGGGGGLDMGRLQEALTAPQFLSAYTDDLFNLDSDFGSVETNRLLNAMSNPKKGLDKYQVMNILGQQGFDSGDKPYFEALTSTIGKKRGKKLAGAVGKAMFRGEDPSRKSIKDAYKYAALTGATGTPKEAQQAMASYFAQTPMGLKNRMPSSQELLAGMKYGPLVGTDSGVFLFGGTDRTNAMFDRLDAGRAFRGQKTKDIFNT